MLNLPPTVRIWLAAQPVDLRKSFDSLAALVRDGLQGDPLSGDIFVFRNKAADRIKLLIWESGTSDWKPEPSAFRRISRLSPASRSAPRTSSCSSKGSISRA